MPLLLRLASPSESWRTHSTSNEPLLVPASAARILLAAAGSFSIRSILGDTVIAHFPQATSSASKHNAACSTQRRENSCEGCLYLSLSGHRVLPSKYVFPSAPPGT